MRARTMWRRVLSTVAVAATVVAGTVLPARPAEAAGVITHAWMALDAVEQVTDPELRALLEANLPYVRAGAHFPDSGYVPGATYGEEAHWQRYIDALAVRIGARPECTDLADPTGPCARLIAFLMGIVGHSYGDEVWDWLFEPYVPDLDEYYTPASLGGFATEGGAELQLDLVAVGLHGRPGTANVQMPDTDDLLAAFADAGLSGVAPDELELGQMALELIPQVEASWAPEHLGPLMEAMPWTSRNFVTAPGGVNFAATAIAAALDNLWATMQGNPPATSVSITFPADGDRRLPAEGWDRSILPGSARGRGGARNRIVAVLDYAAPFRGPANGNQPVSNELPAGSLTLTTSDGGAPVPLASGYPKVVPYTADPGEHLVAIQPAGNLAPCTWYTVEVTELLLDGRGNPVTPYSWEFRTGTDGAGSRCADDPLTGPELFVSKVVNDVLDRDATDAERATATAAFERGGTRGAFTDGVLTSEEHRRLLVAWYFDRYLGRQPDPAGLTYWTNRLRTTSLTDLAVHLLASPEAFRNGGSTNAGFAAYAYPRIQERAVDPSGAGYWTRRLDGGLSRAGFARQLLTSNEAARRTVISTYQTFLNRDPDPGGLTHWTKVLRRGTDVRQLWRSIILTAEYDRNAQR